ncbi:formate-dependent phosphoribosylglycinamide formyltransferase [Undibacterium arcticum]
MKIPNRLGTPLSPSATKVMLLGSGELGKEVIIALQRLGVEVIAVDRYPGAPGHQVAHRAHVIDMTDGKALAALIAQEQPDLVVPEIEAIATQTLVDLERAGKVNVIPTARAAWLTMNREGIRRLAAEELGQPTSPYRFADTLAELKAACAEIGFPCLIKPVMSSSGKGQSKIDAADEVADAWDYAAAGGRVGAGRVIVEGFIDFDYEITQLTVRAIGADGAVETHFCEPIGHLQVKRRLRRIVATASDARGGARQGTRNLPKKVTDNLGGLGIFLGSNCLSKAIWCGSPRSVRGRTIPAW